MTFIDLIVFLSDKTNKVHLKDKQQTFV